jgi:DNA/RNA endonuclease YhcR with UshA esterase domain
MRSILFSALCSMVVLTSAICEDAPKPLTPAEAAKKLNEEVTIEFEVKSASLRDGLGYLNTESDFKDTKNFTVFLDRKTVTKFKEAKIEDPAAHFNKKTVQVKGKVVLHREKPQIVLSGPDAIKIIEKK